MDKRVALALLIACAATAGAAEDLRTLFHTPAERARLDRLRRGEPAEAPQAAARRAGVVTGFVKRSDGRNTVWIDGRPQPMGSSSAQYTDPSKVQDARRADAPPIEVRRTK